jgi:predicted RNA-binding protein (virulence factor B family)
MNLGLIKEYKVLRETNIGYTLIHNEMDYFLHKNETNFRKLKEGENVKAFLYLDKQKRPALTLAIPNITVEQPGFATVVNSVKNLGVFVNIGISKDILLSKDELPEDYKLWPIYNDKILGILIINGSRLVFSQLTREEILNLSSNEPLFEKDYIDGYIYNISVYGINLVSKNYHLLFVHFSNLRKQHRIGELLNVQVTQVNKDDYFVTALQSKLSTIEIDSEAILKYLKANNGEMPYTSKSTPEIIFKVFKISKAAFKRALGNLYKNKIVLLEDEKTILL